MGMNGESDVGCVGAGLDGERHFTDQLARVRANDAATQKAVAFRIKQQLGKALVAAER